MREDVDTETAFQRTGPVKPPVPKKAHYYGDTVRRLFFAAGIFLLFGFPFFRSLMNIPMFLPIVFVVVIDFLAGFTSPKQWWVMIVDMIMAFFGIVAFETAATVRYAAAGADDLFFWFNQTLAILFFIVLYYCVKTFRSTVFESNS